MKKDGLLLFLQESSTGWDSSVLLCNYTCEESEKLWGTAVSLCLHPLLTKAAPMPCDTDLGRPQTPPPGSTLGVTGNKIGTGARTSDSEALGETISGSIFCKNEADSVPPSPKKPDDPGKLKDLTSSPTEEEDCCPTCLEEYDDENPRIMTKREHHFHLSCILEWMERSDTCPVYDQVFMVTRSVVNFPAYCFSIYFNNLLLIKSYLFRNAGNGFDQTVSNM
ncbi:hypothetical protein MKW94_029529 [Papaver nudicaule]|uniref:RING-type E3 ubiquitin transferase n=1 Tax=Papaver nudicaule TaxID=74823 RepID=A0AA41VKD4_PAPNU|nr:hypothetical protein [Papaver nudicaule]